MVRGKENLLSQLNFTGYSISHCTACTGLTWPSLSTCVYNNIEGTLYTQILSKVKITFWRSLNMF